MRAKKTLWILLVAVSSCIPGAAVGAGKKEKPKVDGYAAERDNYLRPGVANASTGKAYFTVAEAETMLKSSTALDDALLAALEAIAEARARIQSSRKCQKFFHDEGLKTLDRTFYTLQFIPANSVAALVDDDTVVLNRSAEGVFMKPPLGFARLKSVVEIRAFYILHELGHELSQFTKFAMDHSVARGDNQSRHQRNNELLLENCY